jgi:hypothetical protein
MWLNLVMMGTASLAVGFVAGWITACPRRWDAHFCDEAERGRPPADSGRAVHSRGLAVSRRRPRD